MTSFATKTVSTALASLVALSSFAVVPSFAAGPRYCDHYARDVANHRANPGNVLAGTAIGAGTGALLGAVLGNGHTGPVVAGAVIGGAGGTMVAGSNNSGKWHRVYDQAYWDCRHNM